MIESSVVEAVIIGAILVLSGFLVFWFSLKAGAILKKYKDDYQAIGSIDIDNSVGFNLIYRIIYTPIFILILSLIFGLSEATGVNEWLWVIAVIVALLQMAVLLILSFRVLLVNLKLYIVTFIISILASIYLCIEVIPNGIQAYIPDKKDIGLEIMLAFLAFTYGIIKNISETNNSYQNRLERYVLFRKKKILKKYRELFDGYNGDEVNIALSIIYEDYNRPYIIRSIEKVVGAETTDITQTKGARSDKEGIKKLLIRIKQTLKKGIMSDEAVAVIANEHNPGSNKYSQEVLKIYGVLKRDQ